MDRRHDRLSEDYHRQAETVPDHLVLVSIRVRQPEPQSEGTALRFRSAASAARISSVESTLWNTKSSGSQPDVPLNRPDGRRPKALSSAERRWEQVFHLFARAQASLKLIGH